MPRDTAFAMDTLKKNNGADFSKHSHKNQLRYGGLFYANAMSQSGAVS